MKRSVILLLISLLTLSFCISRSESIRKTYTLAYVQNVYVDYNLEGGEGDSKRIENFIGIFSSDNDTTSIYKLNNNLSEIEDQYFFWSKKKNENSIDFYSFEDSNIRVVFKENDSIIVDNDIYIVNKNYYDFLRQKIIREGSVLDLAFFLKDGYGDYRQVLAPLNRNWRNQRMDPKHKIISSKIKNRDYQTDDQFFEYRIEYTYDLNGTLTSISGMNRYNKSFVTENDRFIQYKVTDGGNERSNSEEIIFHNKKTLFDSIVGSYENYGLAETSYFSTYQTKLKTMNVDKKPSVIEAIKLLLNSQ